jgi:hypothetical protein
VRRNDKFFFKPHGSKPRAGGLADWFTLHSVGAIIHTVRFLPPRSGGALATGLVSFLGLGLTKFKFRLMDILVIQALLYPDCTRLLPDHKL